MEGGGKSRVGWVVRARAGSDIEIKIEMVDGFSV